MRSLFKESFFDKRCLSALILAVVVIIIYSNTLHAPFEFDDNEYIIENPAIRDLDNLINPSGARDWLQRDSLVSYTFRNRFIGYLTFAINYRINGFGETGYHVVNIAIHILNVLLVYSIVGHMIKTPRVHTMDGERRNFTMMLPFFTAFLFACHPVQTQAVTYISQRFASLSAFFCLLSLLLYVQWRLCGFREESSIEVCTAGKRSLKRTVWYLSSLASAVLAMMTKEISFVLPLLIALFEFMFMNGGVRRRLFFLLPFFLTMLIIPLNIIDTGKPFVEWLTDVDRLSRAKTAIPRFDYLLTEFSVIVTYIRLLFLPVNQTVDYDFPLYKSFFEKGVYMPLIVILSLLVCGMYLLKKSRPAARFAAFGIFWFFLSLSVESSFIPTNDLAFEHRLYMPSVGFFLVLVSVLFVLMELVRTKFTAVTASSALSAVIILLCIAAYNRNSVWIDGVTLWQDSIRKAPNKSRGYNELGRIYYKKDEFDNAIGNYKKAIELDPTFIWAYHNLGLALYKKGLMDEALGAFERSTELGLNSSVVYSDIGAIYYKKGMMKEAISYFNSAMRSDPNNALPVYNLGVIYRLMCIEDKADYYFSMAHKLRPDMY